MTAEIAIINKSAVVLAADSAVTINVGGSEKIYNTVNKIFDLGMGCPMGIMIYGNLEYMGIPFETLIKIYRKKILKNNFDTVDLLFEDFLNYLKSFSVSEKEEIKHISNILYERMNHIHALFYSSLIKSMSGKAFTTQVNKILSELVNKRIRSLKRTKRSEDFNILDDKLISQKYSEIIPMVIESVFGSYKLFKNTSLLLKELSIQFLVRSVMSGRNSGIVIAGFGANQLFPALKAFEIDGIVLGKLKYRHRESVEIGQQDSVNAGILPFAQKEMVERFLKGVDPEYEQYIHKQFSSLLSATGKKLINENSQDSEPEKIKILEKMEQFVQASIKELMQKTETYKDEAFNQKVLDMVLFMPKQELANMAESLINLTSLERRVSAERETVGGPVDVAVISKDEGFVWIKRKHYFSAELNPRYFAKLRNDMGC